MASTMSFDLVIIRAVFSLIFCWNCGHAMLHSDSNLVWVTALATSENYHSACRRVNAMPILDSQWSITWNDAALLEVSSLLNYTSGGLMGCCASGMWCNDETCFTQSWGIFENYGWIDIPNALPVYACNRSAGLTPIQRQFQVANINNGRMTMVGTSLMSQDMVITVGNEKCTDIQHCNAVVCRSCASVGCSSDSVCLTSNGVSSCFLYCAGPTDTSCPCGTFCDSVSVYTGSKGGMRHVNLCTPKSFAHAHQSNVCSGYGGNNQEVIQCALPRSRHLGVSQESLLWNVTVLTTASAHSSLASLGSSGTVVTVFEQEIDVMKSAVVTKSRCKVAADCHDHNLCTKDVCSNSSRNGTVIGQCLYFPVAFCSSETPYNSGDRPDSVSYIPIILDTAQFDGNDSAGLSFVDELLQKGQRSAVSNVDDFPQSTAQLGFNFTLYGNRVSEASINANGVIVLPPINSCTGSMETVDCVVFSTYGNGMSIWAADWDPSHSGGIYTLQQQLGDASLVEGADGTSWHVLYSDMRLYDQPDKSSAPATFSLSLYVDGSSRMRYHQSSSSLSQSPGRVRVGSGLWGSQVGTSQRQSASSSGSGTDSRSSIAHTSLVDTSLLLCPRGRMALVQCQLSTVACVVETCVRPRQTVQILWRKFSCDALLQSKKSGSYQLQVSMVCVWAGGLASTPAIVVTANSSNPFISEDTNSLVNCEVPLLPKISSGSVIRLDLLVLITQVHSATSQSTVLGSSEQQVHGVFVTPDAEKEGGVSEEVSRSSLKVKYYDSTADGQGRCGCNALSVLSSSSETGGGGDGGGDGETATQRQSCDAALVCGGHNATVDCHKVPFGSAYIDSCGDCTGGLTGRVPSLACSDSSKTSSSWSSQQSFELFVEVVVLVSIACMLSGLTNTLSRMLNIAARRSRAAALGQAAETQRVNAEEQQEMFWRQLEEARLGQFVRSLQGRLDHTQRAAAAPTTGLTSSERTALGEIVISPLHLTGTAAASRTPDDLGDKMDTCDNDDDVEMADMSDGVIPDVETGLLSSSTVRLPSAGARVLDCSICLTEFVEGDKCRQLPAPCGHIFHTACIDKWLVMSRQCPLCKRNLRSLVNPHNSTATTETGTGHENNIYHHHQEEEEQEQDMTGLLLLSWRRLLHEQQQDSSNRGSRTGGHAQRAQAMRLLRLRAMALASQPPSLVVASQASSQRIRQQESQPVASSSSILSAVSPALSTATSSASSSSVALSSSPPVTAATFTGSEGNDNIGVNTSDYGRMTVVNSTDFGRMSVSTSPPPASSSINPIIDRPISIAGNFRRRDGFESLATVDDESDKED